MPHIERVIINAGLAAFLKGEKLFLTKTVGEIIFDGYSDPILSAGTDLAALGIHIAGKVLARQCYLKT